MRTQESVTEAMSAKVTMTQTLHLRTLRLHSRLNRLLLSALLGALLQSASVTATEIRIIGGNYCPYSCEDPANPGLAIELLQQSLAGSHYRIQRVTNLPWIRDIISGTKSADSGNEAHGVIAITPHIAPEMLFPDYPMALSNTCFYTRRHFDWQFKGDESAPLRLGLVKYYDLASAQTYVTNTSKLFLPEYIYGQELAARLIKLLISRRVDAIYESEAVVNWKARELDKQESIQEAGCPVQKLGLYIGFNPKIEEATKVMALYNQRFPELVASGAYHQLLVKYGIEKESIEGVRNPER